tara:strand:- start:1644 stop:1775 length:132 start_codon:yes stop_codon:yes gene_type:complete
MQKSNKARSKSVFFFAVSGSITQISGRNNAVVNDRTCRMGSLL